MLLLAAPFALVSWLLLAWRLPTRHLALIAGILLPIDVFTLLPALVLDVGRYVVLSTLIISTRAASRVATPVKWTATSLLLIGIYATVSGVASPNLSAAFLGTTMVASTLVAVLLCARSQTHQRLLAGFLIGVTWSALDVLLQSLGLPFLGSEAVSGRDYSGFSEKRTHLAPQLALAAVLYVTPMLWSRLQRGIAILVRAAGLAMVLFALVLSGGRGGFLSLAFALGIWVVRTLHRHPVRATLVIGLSAVFLYSQRDSFLMTRLLGGAATEGARSARNAAAFRAIQSAPLLGPDPNSAVAAAGGNAHIPLLVFGVHAGLVGILGGAVVMAALAMAVVHGLYRNWQTHPHGPLMATIMLTTSAIEPTAFFVGAGRTVPLLIVMAACFSIERSSKADLPATLSRRGIN